MPSMQDRLDTIDPRLLDLGWDTSLSDEPLPSLTENPGSVEVTDSDDNTWHETLENGPGAIPESRRPSLDVLHLLGQFEWE